MATLIGPRPARRAEKILRRRVARALEEIDKRGPLEPRVHEARRDLKKARATLKLIRPAIPGRMYKRENALCRDAGRILSATRDAQALRAAWRGLKVTAPAIERRLAEDARKAAATLQARKSRQILLLARSQAKKLDPARPAWKGVEDGLRDGYRAGRRAWKRARRTGADADFHEWRKRVKDQRYQVDLFCDGAAELEELDRSLHRLSDLLGDEHDLVVLREKVGDLSLAALQAIGIKRARLREQALALADRVYDEPPRVFVKRVKRAWKRGRDLKE